MDTTDENKMKELAQHLRCPDGDTGIEVANMMNQVNNNIITRTIESLNISNENSILEIGPGNGNHIIDVITLGSNLMYHGIDISETMILEAKKNNIQFQNVSFQLTNGENIPFKNDSFDKIFTVNTIYFWENDLAYATEIARVMKEKAVLSIGFIPKSAMEQIPFTKYNFNKKDIQSVINLLEKVGLKIKDTITDVEMVFSNTGEEIEREYVVLTATKQ
ncbi:MAG: hypothetical protein BM557_05525 [Flavobacterium sp. MedPE-SWcel]|uniref:class I SAM-dependent methyltransferase n=1 Tax=uncultured Flavobacterium sp. TaxID=165435 RepID=UPI000911452D|nr:methyltransferase domain-containing protein [uncultured Flavobacterium sp.]OIQ20132.1 MAG: hypothetical protein BM557_05525 [Flavobacterium sp. MedPE-SWcel]